MRTLLTALMLIVYVGLFNLYIYELTHVGNTPKVRLFYNYLTLGMFLYTILDLKSGADNWLHKELNNICILAIVTNFLLIILNWHLLLKDAATMFFIFNTSFFITTVLILISAIRHKIHEN